MSTKDWLYRTASGHLACEISTNNSVAYLRYNLLVVFLAFCTGMEVELMFLTINLIYVFTLCILIYVCVCACVCVWAAVSAGLSLAVPACLT